MTGRFDAETLSLRDELERLQERAAEIPEELEDTDPGTARAQDLRDERRDVEQAGEACVELLEQYGPDATVTVRGLDAGEYAKVENRTAEASARRQAPGGVPGTGKIVFAAAGMIDAPFYDSDPDDLDAKIACFVGEGEYEKKSVGVRKLFENLITERMNGDSGNWRDYDVPSSTDQED